MHSVIEDIWYGNTSYCDKCGEDDPDIERIALLMSENETILRKEIPQEQKQRFTQYVSWADKYACYIAAAAFRDGFSLASKLLTEALLKNQNNSRSSV